MTQPLRKIIGTHRLFQTMHTLNIPMTMAESVSESVMATASGTPVPERDAALEGTSAPGIGLRSGENKRSIPTPQDPVTEEREDLGRVQWLYRDPDGREQGRSLLVILRV